MQFFVQLCVEKLSELLSVRKWQKTELQKALLAILGEREAREVREAKEFVLVGDLEEWLFEVLMVCEKLQERSLVGSRE